MNKREMNRILRQVRDEVPNQIRASLAGHKIKRLPTLKELEEFSPEALATFAKAAQGDARVVGLILLPRPRPKDYPRGVAMLGMVAGHMCAANKYEASGDHTTASTERRLAAHAFLNLVPRWAAKWGYYKEKRK